MSSKPQELDRTHTHTHKNPSIHIVDTIPSVSRYCDNPVIIIIAVDR